MSLKKNKAELIKSGKESKDILDLSVKSSKELYKLVESFPEKIEKAYKNKIPEVSRIFDRAIVVGMGGSYIAGLVFKSMFEEELGWPVEVVHSIKFVDKHAQYILISYSGNTKEVLLALNKLKNLDKRDITVVTSGGKLMSEAKKRKINIIGLEKGLHQRFTFAESFFPLIKLFEKFDYLSSKNNMIKKIITALKKERKLIESGARELAEDIKEETPLVYSSEYFYPAAYRMQTALEEDAKIIVHSNTLPEVFHNELEALPASYFYPILILDDEETKPFENQIKFFKKHIRFSTSLGGRKYSREERMFLIFYFADFLGYYLSEIRMTDFGNTPLSDKIKKI
jgi:glucose/mannose-6-phosphate isomerase